MVVHNASSTQKSLQVGVGILAAGAAVATRRRGERDDCVDLAQPNIHGMFQDGSAVTRAQALAVHDAHAVQAAPQCLLQEASQCLAGLGGRESVQVDFILHGKLATAQPFEQAGGDPTATKLQFIAGLDQPVARRKFQALLQGLLIVEAPEPGARTRPWFARRRGECRQWTHVRDGLAETGFGVLVVLDHGPSAVRNPSVRSSIVSSHPV